MTVLTDTLAKLIVSVQGTDITIPNIYTYIDEFAFSYDGLTSVVIPDSVTEIGDFAFSRNELTSVVIPDSVTAIGEFAFSNNKLTSIKIPGSVKSIGESAFSHNELTDVYLGEGLTSIGESAFLDNYDLHTIELPHSLTSIHEGSFGNTIYNRVKKMIIPTNPKFDVELLPDVQIFLRSEPNSEPEPEPETSSYNGIVLSIRDREKLKGTAVADAFTFDFFDVFTKKTADKIIGFDRSEGDTIAVSKYAFPALKGANELSFASANNKKELKQLSKQDYDFVYFEKKGRLYFDGNGSGKDWGDANEGGLFAVLKGKPELTVEDFTLLA